MEGITLPRVIWNRTHPAIELQRGTKRSLLLLRWRGSVTVRHFGSSIVDRDYQSLFPDHTTATPIAEAARSFLRSARITPNAHQTLKALIMDDTNVPMNADDAPKNETGTTAPAQQQEGTEMATKKPARKRTPKPKAVTVAKEPSEVKVEKNEAAKKTRKAAKKKAPAKAAKKAAKKAPAKAAKKAATRKAGRVAAFDKAKAAKGKAAKKVAAKGKDKAKAAKVPKAPRELDPDRNMKRDADAPARGRIPAFPESARFAATVNEADIRLQAESRRSTVFRTIAKRKIGSTVAQLVEATGFTHGEVRGCIRHLLAQERIERLK